MSALLLVLVMVLLQPAQPRQPGSGEVRPDRHRALGVPFLVAVVGTLGKLWCVQLSIALIDADLLGGLRSLRWPLTATVLLMIACGLISFAAVQGGIADPAMESHVFV